MLYLILCKDGKLSIFSSPTLQGKLFFQLQWISKMLISKKILLSVRILLISEDHFRTIKFLLFSIRCLLEFFYNCLMKEKLGCKWKHILKRQVRKREILFNWISSISKQKCMDFKSTKKELLQVRTKMKTMTIKGTSEVIIFGFSLSLFSC